MDFHLNNLFIIGNEACLLTRRQVSYCQPKKEQTAHRRFLVNF